MLLVLAFATLPAGSGCNTQSDCDAGLSCVNNVCANLGPTATPQPAAVAPRKIKHRSSRVAYREGDPIPPGATVVSLPNYGLWVSGTVLLSTFWALTGSVTAYLCTEGCPRFAVGVSFLPVAGPIVNAFYSDAGAMPFFITMAMLQAGGAALLLSGLLSWKQYIITPAGVGGTF